MRRTVLAVATLLIVTAASAQAAPPLHGVLVPGRSLGGLRLGDSEASVRARYGNFHGTCTDCARPTWYYTYRRFTQQGVGIEFRGGRIAGVFTVWQPVGWRTANGIEVGMPKWRLPQLTPQQCAGYLALTRRTRTAVTVYYVLDDRIWAFALLRPDEAVCR
jgi:hypothetical protein